MSNNRLESTTGSAQFSFQYDSSGNVTNNGFRAFNFDKQNRLITSENVSFIHDGEDLIHSKSVVGEPTKYSLYGANQNILFNFDSNNYGTVYYYLNNESVANVKVTATGRELTYQHNDALGSLAVESDVTGTTIKTYHYEPYGFTLEAGQEDSPGFTGQIYDDDLGLNYMKARYYDPMIGRFYSNDPIGFDLSNPMSFNRYSYANNNPYKYVDKTGENIVLWIGGIGAGVIDFVKGDGFNKNGNLTGALGDGYTNGNIGGALLEDALSLVPAGKAIQSVGKIGKFAKKLLGKDKTKPNGDYFPDRPLPRDKYGNPKPESNSPHTQLGTKSGRNGKYPQAREFDKNGKPVKDIDFTDHGRSNHPNPHQHKYNPNKTGGTPKRGPTEPLPKDKK